MRKSLLWVLIILLTITITGCDGDTENATAKYLSWAHPVGTASAKAQTLLYNGGEYRICGSAGEQTILEKCGVSTPLTTEIAGEAVCFLKTDDRNCYYPTNKNTGILLYEYGPQPNENIYVLAIDDNYYAAIKYADGEYKGLIGSDDVPENNNHQIGIKPCVMVDGKLYGDTGYVFSAISCGMMDGIIDSTVDGTKLPEVNNQSNFGTGFSYQLGDGTIIVVMIDGQRIIFRDVEYSGTDIPKQVANFTAEVKETLENGNLLVSFISAPDLFSHTPNGEYEVPTENLSDEVAAGDIIRVWYDGLVTESTHGDSPIQLGFVYQIKKETSQ